MEYFKKLADGDIFEDSLKFVAVFEGEDGAHVGEESHVV